MQDQSLLAFRQFNEASCGVAALRYMFSKLVWPFVNKPIRYMPTEEKLKTKYVTGTEPKAIQDYLDKIGIKYSVAEYCNIHTVVLPALVLYQWGGEGHYGVLIRRTARSVFVFNPYNARIDRYGKSEFIARWYDKPEVKWALSITGIGA